MKANTKDVRQSYNIIKREKIKKKERQTDRHRHRERQTQREEMKERQRDVRQSHKIRGGREREKERERERERERETDRQTERQIKTVCRPFYSLVPIKTGNIKIVTTNITVEIMITR